MIIAIRVKPGAARTSVGGSYPGPYGDALIVEVTAPAVDGRANEAVIRAVADALGIRAAAIRVKTGATGRNKLLDIAEAPAGLDAVVATLARG